MFIVYSLLYFIDKRRTNKLNNKNTKSYNDMLFELNKINSQILSNKNTKLTLTSQQLSTHWYMYTIECNYNTPNGIQTQQLFTGKPEAVRGFIKGLKTCAFLLNN